MDIIPKSNILSSFTSELLEELLDLVITPDAKEVDSLGMSEDSDGIEFPCSQDFEFYMNIAQTVPPHSPGNQTFSSFSNTSEGPTPPTSQDLESFNSADWIEEHDEKANSSRKDDWKEEEEDECPSSQRSQGVYLEATQVPVLTQKPVLFSQVVTEDKEELNIEEDLKLSSEHENVVDKSVSLDTKSCEELLDIDRDAGLVNVDNMETSSEDESLALPLTFTCRADLDRKLNKVDPGLVASSSSSGSALKHKIKSEPNDLAKKIKLELGDNAETKEIMTTTTSGSGVNDKTVTDETGDEALNGEGDCSGGSRTDPSSSIRINTSWSHLLNKPPRLGLSKLERKVNILHEVTILEAEE